MTMRQLHCIKRQSILCSVETAQGEVDMAERTGKGGTAVMDRPIDVESDPRIGRHDLIDLLNQDLAREYQAIITYVVYSQVLKGAEYMAIAKELEKHAAEELNHALIIARQIDYLGGMPNVTPRKVRVSEDPREMLQFDLENENETVRNYRERVRQCEALGEYALAEHIRDILMEEQQHQIDLASALGKEIPDITAVNERA
jgi:bacterioferritin